MGREFELKYRSDDRTNEALQAEYGPFTAISMETTYYDTPDGTLSSRRWTLRRRYESGKSVCTLKTPAKQGRNEWETECDNIQDAVPVLCKLGGPAELPALTAQGLIPICGARFTRYAGLVHFAGAALEIALDTGVLIGGGKELPLCEVEVELKSGEPEAAIAFGMELKRLFTLEPQNKSKFRRALALYRGE